MLRRSFPKADKPAPTLPEIKLVDVTHIDLAFDNGMVLGFDLTEKDTIKKTKDQLVITRGKRVTEIARKRIIYSETYPEQLKEMVKESEL